MGRKFRGNRVTPNMVAKTCGRDCQVDVKQYGYDSWEDYLTVHKEPPRPYRSWLEFRLFNGAMADIPYEPETVPYHIKKDAKYTPDGVYGNIWFEVKGRFRDRAEMEKYLHIRDSHPDKEIVFVLSVPNVAVAGARKRKDGSRRTIEEFLMDHGFRWTYEYCVEEDLPDFIDLTD